MKSYWAVKIEVMRMEKFFRVQFICISSFLTDQALKMKKRSFLKGIETFKIKRFEAYISIVFFGSFGFFSFFRVFTIWVMFVFLKHSLPSAQVESIWKWIFCFFISLSLGTLLTSTISFNLCYISLANDIKSSLKKWILKSWSGKIPAILLAFKIKWNVLKVSCVIKAKLKKSTADLPQTQRKHFQSLMTRRGLWRTLLRSSDLENTFLGVSGRQRSVIMKISNNTTHKYRLLLKSELYSWRLLSSCNIPVDFWHCL